MNISSINSYSHNSFTSQEKKSKKVVKIPCRFKKQPEINNSIQQTEKQKISKQEETFDSYYYSYSTKDRFLENLAGIGYIASLILIPPLMMMAENDEQKTLEEQQPTHPYSETYQYEGTIPSETLPIVLETIPNETFEIVPQETTQDEIYVTIPQETVVDESVVTNMQEKEQENNTLDINGVSIVFDAGTLQKKDANTFYGLVDGAYCVVSRDEYENVTVEKHKEATSDSYLAQTTEYNRDGLIIEIDDYVNGMISAIKKYSYTKNSKIETENIYTTRHSNEIDKVITTYNIKNNEVISKEFQADNKIVATFDFSSDTVTIGSEKNQELDTTMFLLLRMPLMKDGETYVFELDYGSLKNDESTFGLNKYVGTLNGNKVSFNVLENGICVEYLDDNNNVVKSEKYNTKAELVK